MSDDELLAVVERIASGEHSETDIETLRQALENKNKQPPLQLGKYNINIGEGGEEIHIGDRIYFEINDEAIQAIAEHIIRATTTRRTTHLQNSSLEELIEQVRTRLYEDIRKVYGTVPLWGIDHWVELSELFVDLNVLETLSSSRRNEIPELWQDFESRKRFNSNNDSFDRLGIGESTQRVSGLNILQEPGNLLVVGKPGSGKTTYLQRIITECNEGRVLQSRIPALIKLRNFVDSGRDSHYSIKDHLKQYWQLSSADIHLILSKGRAVILLDGLDETTEEIGKKITKQIRSFSERYPQVKMIVTCRTQSFTGKSDWKALRFSFVEIADLNRKQIELFTKHWFDSLEDNLSEDLGNFLEQMNQSEFVRDLATTPILLSLICSVFHYTKQIHSKRSQLYQESLELLLEDWDRSRDIERGKLYSRLPIESKFELLCCLAIKKFEKTQYVLFEQAEIEEYISVFFRTGQCKSREILKTIESQNGLLIERTRRIWSFSHLTFQEYLAARWFCEKKAWKHLAEHIGERKWREIFLLTAEMSKDSSELFLIMRSEIDNIVSEVSEIQAFLTWLSQKADSIKSTYNPAAIRALYLVMLDADINIVQGLGKIIDPTTEEMSIDKYRAFDGNFDGSWDITLDYALRPEKAPEETEIFIASKLDSEFAKVLYKFSKQVEGRLFDREKFDQWWKINGSAWVEEYRNQLIRYRNIGHVWEFSEYQKQVIETYCYANELLLICMNSSDAVSFSVKSSIESSLLLPSCRL